MIINWAIEVVDNYNPDGTNDISLEDMWVEIGLHTIGGNTENRDSIMVINRYIHRESRLFKTHL